MVFLILAAQYERWSLPIAVLLAVPFAVFGALLAVMVRSMPNDIYFQIGLIVLVGLSAKNAILIVEFAAQKREQGLNSIDAAMLAAKQRFRPIVMTSLAFILGVFPLVISSGAGAAARKSMGTGVFGGMLSAVRRYRMLTQGISHDPESCADRRSDAAWLERLPAGT